jgi:hypothetical protein
MNLLGVENMIVCALQLVLGYTHFMGLWAVCIVDCRCWTSSYDHRSVATGADNAGT